MALEYHLFTDPTEEIAETIVGLDLVDGIVVAEHDTTTGMVRYWVGYIVNNFTGAEYVYNRRWRNLENGTEAISEEFEDVEITMADNMFYLVVLPHATSGETTEHTLTLGGSFVVSTLLADYTTLGSGTGSVWDRASAQVPLATFNAYQITIEEDQSRRP